MVSGREPCLKNPFLIGNSGITTLRELLSCIILKTMPTPVEIRIGDLVLRGELYDTPTAKAVAELLPIESEFNVWGDEFYFEINLRLPPDRTATTNVDVGDIGYWPPGRAIAIFFGPTPLSSGDKPVPASEVNLIGRIHSGAERLREYKDARRIEIRAVT